MVHTDIIIPLYYDISRLALVRCTRAPPLGDVSYTDYCLCHVPIVPVPLCTSIPTSTSIIAAGVQGVRGGALPGPAVVVESTIDIGIDQADASGCVELG